jgi:hypothetical protein
MKKKYLPGEITDLPTRAFIGSGSEPYHESAYGDFED